MSEFDADRAWIRPAFEFEADGFVQRAHALREQLAIQHLLGERVAKGQFARRSAVRIDEVQRLGALECEENVVATGLAQRHQPLDGEALTQYRGQRQNFAFSGSQLGGAGEDRAPDRER